MGRLDNLGDKIHKLTDEELSKGGIKSGETRRRRKTLREELLALLEKGDTQENMTLALIQKAMNGDVQAFNSIRDTIGEKPVDKVEQEIVTNIKVDVTDE